MIALDTNIIIYALVSSQPEHARASKWLQKQPEPLATTHTNIGEALRLLTHPKVFPKPLFLKSAVKLLEQFSESFALSILTEPEDWWIQLSHLTRPAIAGNDVFDARIVCTLRFHGVKQICTQGSGFHNYPGLEVVSI